MPECDAGSRYCSLYPFLLELFDARVRTADGKVDTTLVAYLDEQSAPWWSYILRAPGMAVGGIKSLLGGDKEELPADSLAGGSIELSEEEAGKLQSLRQSVLADVDKKTAITTLTVTLQDPKVTATVADSVVSKLQQYIIAYRTRKAKEDCRYLEQLYRERQAEYYEAQQRYAKYVDANSNVVFQSTLAERERLQNDMSLAYQVYSQVAQQLQVARAKVQEEKPVFAVVEPAVVPREPSGTSRKVIVLGWIFLAVAGVAAWELLGKDYWQKFRSACPDPLAEYQLPLPADNAPGTAVLVHLIQCQFHYQIAPFVAAAHCLEAQLLHQLVHLGGAHQLADSPADAADDLAVVMKTAASPGRDGGNTSGSGPLPDPVPGNTRCGGSPPPPHCCSASSGNGFSRARKPGHTLPCSSRGAYTDHQWR